MFHYGWMKCHMSVCLLHSAWKLEKMIECKTMVNLFLVTMGIGLLIRQTWLCVGNYSADESSMSSTLQRWKGIESRKALKRSTKVDSISVLHKLSFQLWQFALIMRMLLSNLWLKRLVYLQRICVILGSLKSMILH